MLLVPVATQRDGDGQEIAQAIPPTGPSGISPTFQVAAEAGTAQQSASASAPRTTTPLARNLMNKNLPGGPAPRRSSCRRGQLASHALCVSRRAELREEPVGLLQLSFPTGVVSPHTGQSRELDPREGLGHPAPGALGELDRPPPRARPPPPRPAPRRASRAASPCPRPPCAAPRTSRSHVRGRVSPHPIRPARGGSRRAPSPPR